MAAIRLIEPDYTSLAYIACYMRQADQDEIYNCIGHRNPFLLAGAALDAARMGSAVVAVAGSQPVAVLGVQPAHTNICRAFAFGTNDFPRVALSLTRYALTVLRPSLIRAGYHRIECESHHSHIDAHRWLERLGFVREGVKRKYGSDGSDYYQYAAVYD